MNAPIRAGLGFFLAVALSLVLPALALAAPITVSGDVTYRERMALPADATLSVALLDLTRGGRTTVHAEAHIGGSGRVPFSFALNFDDKVLVAGHDYAISARIVSGSAILFENPEPFIIDPRALNQPAVITLAFIGSAAPARPASSAPVAPQPAEPASRLFGITWRVDELNNTPTLDKPRITLELAEDGRTGGKGGCNSYFAQAVFSGNAISFGAPAATRMACAGPVMVQENAFFAALGTIAAFSLANGQLSFLDANGNAVIRLSEPKDGLHG
jgi:putative lipoprotein